MSVGAEVESGDIRLGADRQREFVVNGAATGVPQPERLLLAEVRQLGVVQTKSCARTAPRDEQQLPVVSPPKTAAAIPRDRNQPLTVAIEEELRN